MSTKINKNVPALLSWFSQNARDLPWRRTHDPYAIWVSEIMLQQTQVKTVIPYWERWMQKLPTIEALAKARPETIHKLWEGLGYYTRVRNMQKAAQEIMAQHGGRFPENFDAILDLPGIGRYTAGAIASIAFNQPKPLLDGNVIRVLTRLFGIAENPRDKATNEKLWTLAEQLVTTAHAIRNRQHATNCSHLNQSLMELGALICTPKQPQCLLCPVQADCVARRTDKVEELPNLGPRAAATARWFVAFVLESNGKFLAQQRPEGVVNAHLWEFPNLEFSPSPDESEVMQAAQKLFGAAPKSLELLCTVKHSITRYKITLLAFRGSFASINAPSRLTTPTGLHNTAQGRHAPGPGVPTLGNAAKNPPTLKGLKQSGKINASPNEFRLYSLKELHHLAFPSAHRKILERLGK